MNPTPNPPAPQGEDHWPVPPPPVDADTVSMAYPPSAPKAEQVPQEVNKLLYELHDAFSRCNHAEAAALIVAEWERWTLEKFAGFEESLKIRCEHNAQLIQERDQLRRELEQAKGAVIDGVEARDLLQQQLAAFQRENVELRNGARAAYLHSIDQHRDPLTPPHLSVEQQTQLGRFLATYGTSP